MPNRHLSRNEICLNLKNPSVHVTFFLLLSHDSMAECQQSEEGVDLWVLQLHRLDQGVVVEHEARVGQRVEGEVHHLCVLVRETQRRMGQRQRRDKESSGK